jgi:anti-anti-sigma factor
VDGVSVLLILPDRTPDYPDVRRLVQALARGTGVPRVAVDLSCMDHIRSGLMAQLILLKKQVQAVHGKLALCELSPLVREVFRRTCIDTLFEIHQTLPDALRSIRSQTGPLHQQPAVDVPRRWTNVSVRS